MEIQIMEHMEETLKVLIQCRKADDEVLRLKTHIELFDNKFYAKKDDAYCFINASEVLYFEAVDNRTFLYTQEAVLEIRQRLYELEDTLSEKDFIRISKMPRYLTDGSCDVISAGSSSVMPLCFFGSHPLHFLSGGIPHISLKR